MMYTVHSAMKHLKKYGSVLNHQQYLELKKIIINGNPDEGMERLANYQRKRMISFMQKLDTAIECSGTQSINSACGIINDMGYSLDDIEIRPSKNFRNFGFYFLGVMVARLYSDGRLFIFYTMDGYRLSAIK